LISVEAGVEGVIDVPVMRPMFGVVVLEILFETVGVGAVFGSVDRRAVFDAAGAPRPKSKSPS
jgi:hypothetical protein